MCAFGSATRNLKLLYAGDIIGRAVSVFDLNEPERATTN